MRTTITIDEDLYRRAKATAARSGRSVSELIEDAVRQALRPRAAGQQEVPPLPVFTGGLGTQPRADLDDRAAIEALLDEGVSLDALR